MPDIKEIRKMVPAVEQTAYLNTGTCGPVPLVAYEAIKAELELELTPARIDSNHFPAMAEARDEVRSIVAAAINANPSDIAITHKTTEGMYIGIMGYRWQRGDELILSNIEHPGGMLPSFLAKRRYGVRIRVADVGLGGGDPADIVKAFEEKITPRTRMIVLSHVSYTTGATLPLKEIVEMAHAHDVLVVADAAQTFGALHLDMQDLGVDVYACPGQKWACGPEGTGSTYIRPSSIGDFEQTFLGSPVRDSMDYYSGTFTPAPGAARFDTAGANVGQTKGQAAATKWVTQDVGAAWVEERIKKLSTTTWDKLNKLKGVEVVTPKEALSGLIAFTVEGIDPPDLSRRLAEEHNVTIRYVQKYINNPDAARVSLGFYNNEDDIDRFLTGLKAIQKSL